MKTWKIGDEPLPGYKLAQFIARGGFGEVWRAVDGEGNSHAVKLIPIISGSGEALPQEVEGARRLARIRHPNLVNIQTYEMVDRHLAVVMELADDSLADRADECMEAGLPGIPRGELLDYMAQTAAALDVLRSPHRIAHLDVKPSNLLRVGRQAKLADFGSIQTSGSRLGLSSFTVSPPYAAPELFDGEVHESADQFSLAVTYQELLTGHRPFDAVDLPGLLLQHAKGKPNLTPLPPQDRPIVERAIHWDPTERFPSCEAFVKALLEAQGFGPEPTKMFQPNSQPSLRIVTTATVSSNKTRNIFRRRPVQRSNATEFVKVDLAAGNVLRQAMVAFIPQEVYALKLKGFVDTLGAEVVQASYETTVLRLREGLPLLGGIEISVRLDTFARIPNNAWRIMAVTISVEGLKPAEAMPRAQLILAHLKSCMIALPLPYLRARDPFADVS